MSHSYFENRDCEYYPCHAMEHINCLFCFCPLYPMKDCGGRYRILQGEGGAEVKDCSACCLPHTKDGHEKICRRLQEASGKKP